MHSHNDRIAERAVADEGVFQWVVRGVDRGLARRLVETAGERRLTVGELLNEVLREWGASLDATGSPQGDRTAASEGKLEPDSGKELDAIRGRLTALEEALATMTVPARASRKRPSQHSETEDQAQPAPEPTASGERNKAWFLPPTYTRLNEAGVAEIRRRFDIGEPDTDIAKALGVSQQGVNKHTKNWREN